MNEIYEIIQRSKLKIYILKSMLNEIEKNCRRNRSIERRKREKRRCMDWWASEWKLLARAEILRENPVVRSPLFLSLSSPLPLFFPPRSLSSRARASSSFLLDRVMEQYWIENCTKKFFSGLRWISWKTLKTEIFSLLFYLDSGRGEWEEGSRRGRGRKWRSKRAERE